MVTQKHKLFIGGLSPASTSKDLLFYFSQFGPVVEAVVLFDKMKGVSKGFGFCTFGTEKAVEGALSVSAHWIGGVSVAVRHYTSTSH